MLREITLAEFNTVYIALISGGFTLPQFQRKYVDLFSRAIRMNYIEGISFSPNFTALRD